MARLLGRHLAADVYCLSDECLEAGKRWEKNGKTGMLGLDRLKVRWDVALSFLHVIV